MKTTVLNLNEQASEVLQYLMQPDTLLLRIDTLEQAIDMSLDMASGDIWTEDDHPKILRHISELRCLVKDFQTIKQSLTNNT